MEPTTKKLDTWLTGFHLSKQAESCSPNTVKEYRADSAHLARWCSGRDSTVFTPSDLKAFLAHLRTLGNGRGGRLSPKSIYNIWVALKSFHRWLAE